MKVTVKMTMEIGALLRKSIMSEIKDYCFKYDIELDVDEDKGFISSSYRIKLVGEDHRVLRLKRNIVRWADN